MTEGGLPPTGLAAERRRSYESESQSTERGVFTEAIDLSREQNNPFRTRSFERGGPPALQPHRAVSNPVIDASKVESEDSGLADGDVDFVADPFILFDSGQFYMFYEVLLTNGNKDIGYATSPDGLAWTHQERIIQGQNIAYPHVFKHDGTWYMCPDNRSTGSSSTRDFEIWTTDTFPNGTWSVEEESVTGVGSDPTPFYIEEQNRWYMIGGYTGQSGVGLWYADTGRSLTGRTWTEHPSSKIYTSGNSDDIEGPGGRPIVYDNGIVDFMFQDLNSQGIRCFRITDLSTSAYSASEINSSPLVWETLRTGAWNQSNMHHVDLMMDGPGGPPLAAVDGMDLNANFSIGIYAPSDRSPTAGRAVANSSVTVSSGTSYLTAVDLSETYKPTDGIFSNSSYVAETSGWYEVYFQAHWSISGATAPFTISMELQDFNTQGQLCETQRQITETSAEVTIPLATHTYLDELDGTTGIKPRVWQDSGADQTVSAAAERTYFVARRIR